VAAALVIQRVKSMRRIVLSSVVCVALSNFPNYLIKGMIFRKKGIEHKMCVLIFSTILSENFPF
jgi:hypothetical protein